MGKQSLILSKIISFTNEMLDDHKAEKIVKKKQPEFISSGCFLILIQSHD